jgi:hypothetical protein
MSQQSLADMFVEVMAEIRSLNPEEDDPMRYVIWQMQEQAFSGIDDAISAARRISSTVRLLSRDYKDAVKEIAK